MYSYEDRIRAVHLYISLGKRGAATVRQLGYPTNKALKRWHTEYERCDDLAAGYVRLRPKYSTEEKQAAVDHYLHHDQCLAWTVKALGYPGRGTLAAWVDELRPETRKRIVGKVGALPQPREAKESAVVELCMRQESARVIAQRVGVRALLQTSELDGVIRVVLLPRLQAGWRLSVSPMSAMVSASAEGPRPNARSMMRASPRMSRVRLKIAAWPLRRARITSNPAIVAQAVFSVLNPRTGRISCFSLP
jgi:transposase-like protein